MSKELNPLKFEPLPVMDIHPEGWLLRQLQIQAEGQSGNLDKIWDDIKDSAWIGGNADSWERMPYWLDGFIPLAYLLRDDDMMKRADYCVNYILTHQHDDGWICPAKDRGGYDVWALFLVLKVLVQYYHFTHDERIEKAVEKALRALDRHIDGSVLFSWGKMRWFESLISIFWLYERKSEDWLLKLARKLRCQGFDWQTFFGDYWDYTEPQRRGRWSHMSHVVNNAMMLKSGALLWRMTSDEKDLFSAEKMVEMLDKYHGMVTGAFTGDECLSGISPVQGTELCAIAEYMYSLEHLIAATGELRWCDRLESLAYNALPATFSPDMWTHQYDQQVNQIECSRQSEPVFRTNGSDANLFGLEPNYGCCTANQSQAWPKLALSTFMLTEDGIAATVYAPCSVNTKIRSSDITANIQIKLETDYPFKDVLNFTVTSDCEINFTLHLRIPEWAHEPYIEIDGRTLSAQSGTFYKLKGIWKDETKFTLRLPMKTALLQRPNKLYALKRGPLVYSLEITEKWVELNQDSPEKKFPHCDYEVFAVSAWNYGFCAKENEINIIDISENPIGEYPFSPGEAPVVITVQGRLIDWEKEKGVCTPVPRLNWISDTIDNIKFIPYGCTNLRLTEMPLV